jgi:hypothetical protein
MERRLCFEVAQPPVTRRLSNEDGDNRFLTVPLN